MQGHLPLPPQPHVPIGLAPVIGYISTREPQPLDERDPVDQEWWEIDDLDEEEWVPRRTRIVKVVAVILSFSLLVAGVGTVLEIILAAR